MIVTTHVGSLPRSDVLTAPLLAKDNGEAYNGSLFDVPVHAAMRCGLNSKPGKSAIGLFQKGGDAKGG